MKYWQISSMSKAGSRWLGPYSSAPKNPGQPYTPSHHVSTILSMQSCSSASTLRYKHFLVSTCFRSLIFWLRLVRFRWLYLPNTVVFEVNIGLSTGYHSKTCAITCQIGQRLRKQSLSPVAQKKSTHMVTTLQFIYFHYLLLCCVNLYFIIISKLFLFKCA